MDNKPLDIEIKEDGSVLLEREIITYDWELGKGKETISLTLSKKEAINLAESIKRHFDL